MATQIRSNYFEIDSNSVAAASGVFEIVLTEQASYSGAVIELVVTEAVALGTEVKLPSLAGLKGNPGTRIIIRDGGDFLDAGMIIVTPYADPTPGPEAQNDRIANLGVGTQTVVDKKGFGISLSWACQLDAPPGEGYNGTWSFELQVEPPTP